MEFFVTGSCRWSSLALLRIYPWLQVWIYPTPVELVGGAHDGERVVPGFRLDLELLRQEFDSIVASGWDARSLSWPEGPHVSIEGIFRGREVYLQVLTYAPEDDEPGLKLEAT